MSKINRVNEKENYNITVDWLKTFAQSVDNHMPPMVRAHKEKFATIEEKMKDLKDRIGFLEIKKITEDQSQSLIVEAKNKKSKKSTVKKDKIKNLIKFIDDVIQKNPHFSYLEIIAKCRENDGLDFDSIRVNDKKLQNIIHKKIKPKKEDLPRYIHPETDNNPDPMDEIASYFRSSVR